MVSAQLNSQTSTQRAKAQRRDAPERAAAETISRLQRGILRLALAYHGRNASLDSKLKELGALVRAGHRDGLQQLIDEIVDTIVSLDLAGSSEAVPSDAVAGEALRMLLDALYVPAELNAAVEELQSTVTRHGDRAALLAAIERTAAELSAALRRSEQPPALPAVQAALTDLLNRLPLTPGLVNDASSLRHAIERLADEEEVEACVCGLADLVAGLRKELQQELDQASEFLVATAKRLEDFEKVMHRSSEMHADASADALQLSDTLGVEMRGLREDVHSAEDLKAVKGLIDHRLTSIDATLDDFIEAQNRRACEANDAIDGMRSRLHELESQTAHLREDLEEQKERIMIDPLTGVLNRAGYGEMMSKLFARWRRYGGSLSLAVIDLDLFKEINDSYGHTAGDKVLATVATKIQEMIRESDVLCRYGGEEFTLILPDTPAADGKLLLDRLRVHVEQCPFRHKDTPVTVTLSCGITQFRDQDTVESAFERADQNMYEAKRHGRNRVWAEGTVDADAAAQTV